MTKSFTVEQLRCLELARIIREGLEGVRFDMTRYRGACGTAACIAGHAVAVYDQTLWKRGCLSDIGCRAAKLLGLNSVSQQELFSACAVDNWGSITPAMAAATLENYALTDKVEWAKP